jgi:hypothetical protein
MMRTNTKKFSVLEFIGSKNGVRYMDIERYLCDLAGYDYDKKVETRVWDYRTSKSKYAMVRQHKGIWGTNLCYGKDAILHKYCVKGMDRKWRLSPETAGFISNHYRTVKPGYFVWTAAHENSFPPSSLDVELPSDTIQGNSVVVSRQLISLPDLGDLKSVDRFDLQGGCPPKPAAVVLGPNGQDVYQWKNVKPPVMNGPTINCPVEIKKPVEDTPITRCIERLQTLRFDLEMAASILQEAQRRHNELLMEIGRAKTDVRNLLDL